LANILNRKYTGLGEVLVAALFLRENDMHLGNIGVDKNGRIVKIDGGFIFVSNKKATAADIAALPMLSESYPDNWIGIHYWEEEADKSIFDPNAVLTSEQIRDLPAFRREVNQMLLKICLLPDELIRKMIFLYSAEESDAKKITAFILRSKQEMGEAAKANAGFLSYLVSADAESDLKAYLLYLEQFKTTGKHYLLRDNEKDRGFAEAMTTGFIALRKEAVKPQAQSCLSYIGSLFGLTSAADGDESIAQRLRMRP
jgi:hypothetical protein